MQEQEYATTTVDGVQVVVFADRNVGLIFARAAGCGGSGLTVDEALSDWAARHENAGRPPSNGFITPPRWRSVPLGNIRL